MDPTKYPIRYFADLNPGTGFNVAARGYVEALQHLGYDPNALRVVPAIRADFHAGELDKNDWLEDFMHGDWAGDNSNDRINIVHLHPGMVGGNTLPIGEYHTALEGRWNIAVTAWETDKLPEVKVKDRTIVSDLNKYDEVWVPTKWVKETFERCGVTTPVFVIPHVLLGAFLQADPSPRDPKETVFYTVGSWNARKHPEMVVRSYFATGWNPVSGTILHVYSVPPTREPGRIQAHGYMVHDVVKQLTRSLPDGTSPPPFGLHTVYVPSSQVIHRHQNADVFVSATRGEGFFLPALEAAAMGNWIIGGGPWLEELAEVAGRVEDGGLVDLLPTELEPVTPMPECLWYELDQQWYEVKQKDMMEALKAAHDSKAGARDRMVGAKAVRDFYSPRAVAKKFLQERLEAAHAALEGSGW